ncbi:Starch-binding associating with outer membrane [Filimonas lacunae]|uniref:Starch-binding associating with outer membrane n=1 Tax=Filimonas lacunae TaxID=477680 RepID=A0A173MN73_9BACT|nr:RagB/SusD family nutrient uptake outer membrane protein [Filimonas lacunae]BAV08900.1 outer membrane protein, nutrient binding [Filimonas lacunae]SIS63680.1 Starch-binding associating with outer membrane [Filimonas lacunae]
MKNLFIQKAMVVASIAAITFSSGCNKFLEQPVNGILPEDEFYKTDKDAMQAATAVYDMMQTDYNTVWGSMFIGRLMLSDESNAGGNGPGDQPGFQDMDLFKHDSQNEKVYWGWRLCYYTIYRANKVVAKVTPDNDLRKRLIAEAKALRAYNYFELVTLWGDVPLVLADIAPEDYTKTKRSPKADIYAQIVKDLQEAIPVLPVKSGYAAGDKFRMSKGAAQALLGKAYLYQEKWTDAATQFDLVINSGEYNLAPSVAAVFARSGEFGIESLFEISYSETQSYDWGNFPWDKAPEANIYIQLMGPRSDNYTKAPGDSLLAGWGFCRPKKKLYDAYVAAGDVVRRKTTVMSEAELKAAGGDWNAPTAYEYEGYFQRKYGSFSTQTNSNGSAIPELNYGTNWRLIRYADVLLMAAEAQYRAGSEGTSRTYLNKVRNRSGLGDVSATGTALFTAIVTERELELAFEGFRFLDLVRWGLAEQELGPLGFKKGKNEVLPIPDQDVKTAGLKQNDNY